MIKCGGWNFRPKIGWDRFLEFVVDTDWIEKIVLKLRNKTLFYILLMGFGVAGVSGVGDVDIPHPTDPSGSEGDHPTPPQERDHRNEGFISRWKESDDVHFQLKLHYSNLESHLEWDLHLMWIHFQVDLVHYTHNLKLFHPDEGKENDDNQPQFESHL